MGNGTVIKLIKIGYAGWKNQSYLTMKPKMNCVEMILTVLAGKFCRYSSIPLEYPTPQLLIQYLTHGVLTHTHIERGRGERSHVVVVFVL